MANWDSMMLQSDNKAKFNEIMKGFDPKVRVREQETDAEKGVIYFRASPLPDEAVKELSAQNPEMTFTAECSFEADYFTHIWTVEYKKGRCKEIGLKLGYLWPGSNFSNKAESKLLIERITEIFRRIDPVSKVGGKEFKVDVYDPEVTVSAVEGDFKMQATKSGEEVTDIKMFRKKTTFTWENIIDAPF